MAADVLTRRHLNRATLARQMLLAREPLAVADAVSRLAGLQAQEPAPPFVGLWTRIVGFRADDLLAVLRDHDVVRATAMRGTLHLLTAGDYLAWRGAVTGAEQALATLGPRAAGIDHAAALAAARALFAERPRTLGDLRAALAARFRGADERALGHLARLGLPLVMVPSEDRWGYPRDPSFALAEAWLGAAPDRRDAFSGMVRRYLAAFGPATPADFAAWSGTKVPREAFEALRPDLAVFRDEGGRELFDLPDAPRPDPNASAPPRFLPAFDNLLLAHADRTRVIADEHRPRVVTKNLRVHPTFTVDGFVAGTWGVERGRATATLRLAPFGTIPETSRTDLDAAGRDLLRFLEPHAAREDVVWAG